MHSIMTGKHHGDIKLESLIVNVDYCGTCRGTCPTCVLTKDERLLNKPLTNSELVIKALRDISSKYGKVHDSFIFGFGRGNHLVLPDSTIPEMLEILGSIDELYEAEEFLIEISTSLVGKIDPQIDRAKTLIDTINKSFSNFDVRFVVVANVGVSSEKYWQNVFKFLSAIEEHRGGIDDGNGDIVQINVSLDSLPDLQWLEEFFKDFPSPLNIAWVPAFDVNSGKKEFMDRFEHWLGGFYEMTLRNDLDTNIRNWGHRSMRYNDSDLKELMDNAIHSSKSLLYVDPQGNYHNGYPTIMADMDPIRFDPHAAELHNGSRKSILNNDGKEILNLLKNKACRQCKYISACYHSGGYRLSLISMRYNKNNDSMCLNGLRQTFERMEAYV